VKRLWARNTLIMMAAALMITAIASFNVGKADDEGENQQFLRGRIVALGIPGASTISAVGVFLPGGPIHDNAALAAFTMPGRVLDPVRILVGSTSNFGAPVAHSGQLPGSFLSIDPRFPDTLAIPPDFAAAGDQASALFGRVQMYSAQSPAFRNDVNNPSAVTAEFTAVSNPLGLSINNAFGRLWPANAPTGLQGIGTSTIVDPSGIPLAGAPSALAGGVFAGNLTPRQPSQIIPGALNRGAVGTAFLGHSPDGSTRAVFSVVLADGSLVQEHAAKNLDGLAPIGTVHPLLGRNWNEGDDEAGVTIPRLGVILNYSPTRILYVTEPFDNTIAALHLADDGLVFYVAEIRRIRSRALDQPVDMAPVAIETTNPNWASNTTLDAGADFYVANRGNNTVVRMRQDGTVVAVREVRLADGRSLGDGRLNGIAGSPDGNKIWATVVGRLAGYEDASGAVLELPAF
jgi:hypothetical protein